MLRSFPLSRTERTIASVRLVISVATFLAIWLDPGQRPSPLDPAPALLTIYVAYACVTAALMWRQPARRWLVPVTHGCDLVAFSVLQYLVLVSPNQLLVYFMFSLFTFALFSAALRWGWRGTLATTGLVVLGVLAIAASRGRALGAPELERLAIRTVYLSITAGLLAYLGHHETRVRDVLQRLARWPRGVPESEEAVARVVLEQAAEIGQAERAVVVWEVQDEPWVHVASWDRSGVTIRRGPPGEFEPLVPEPLKDGGFLCPGPAESGIALISRAGALAEWRGVLVHRDLLPFLRGRSLASAPFHTEQVSGRLFLVDLATTSAGILLLAEVVARQVGASFDDLYLSERLRQVSIGNERLRVARDFHDGVLQALTGVRLELRSIAAGLGDGDPHRASEGLRAAERALAAEQRELRAFIEGLRRVARPMTAGAALAESLQAVRERIAAQWKVPVAVRVRPSDVPLSESLREAVPLMVHEGVINALKHAGPSRVAVDVSTDGGALRIAVRDDGRGFPFQGRYDHAALQEANLGPISLRERVASLGGTLTVESTPAGSCVEVVLPLAAAGRA